MLFNLSNFVLFNTNFTFSITIFRQPDDNCPKMVFVIYWAVVEIKEFEKCSVNIINKIRNLLNKLKLKWFNFIRY